MVFKHATSFIQTLLQKSFSVFLVDVEQKKRNILIRIVRLSLQGIIIIKANKKKVFLEKKLFFQI